MAETAPYQAHKTIYLAEEKIRERYRVSHPEWRFWHEVAGYLNYWASKGAAGRLNTIAETREFNRAQAMANYWLDLFAPDEDAGGNDGALRHLLPSIKDEQNRLARFVEEQNRIIEHWSGRGDQALDKIIEERTDAHKRWAHLEQIRQLIEGE